MRLASRGVDTVQDFADVHVEDCGSSVERTAKWLRGAVPGSHPVSTKRAARWIAEWATQQEAPPGGDRPGA